MDRSAVSTDTFRDMFVGYLIGTRLWRRRFGADPRVVGRVVEVFGDEYSFRIAGVMPETFAFPPGIETWSVSLPMWSRTCWMPRSSPSSCSTERPRPYQKLHRHGKSF